MEQKDYLLREIEKIGVIVNAIRQKILGGKGGMPTDFEHQIENEKEELLSEVNFDLDKLLGLNGEELSEYVFNFEGFNIENIEILAECFSEIGFSNNCDNSKKYLEKALQLYNICASKSKTYSLEREVKIKAIINALR